MSKRLAILTTAIAMLGAAFSASATVCPTSDVATGTQCNVGQTFCGGNCVNSEPACSPGGTESCTVPQKALICSSCTWQCTGGKVDCSATNGNCQATNTGCAATGQKSVCNATAAATTQSCGGCLAGYLDCDATAAYNCKSTTNVACLSPKVWDPCANTCNDPAYLSPSSAQTGDININGDITTNSGNLYILGNALGGDVYMSSGKAIHVDNPNGATELNVGNWGGGAGSDFGFNIHNNANSNLSAYGLNIRRTRADATPPGASFGSILSFTLEGFTNNVEIAAATIRGSWETSQTDDTTARDSYLALSTLRDGLMGERLHIDSSGLVGLTSGVAGTITPGFGLDVRSALAGGSDTAIINISNENLSRVFTGLRIARGAPSTERWFIGMNSTDDLLRIRRSSATDDLTVDASGNLTMFHQSSLRLSEATANGTNYVGFRAPAALPADVTWTLPTADGTNGQVLSTDGAGTLSWSSTANSCSGRQFVGLTATFHDGNLDVTSPSSPTAAATGYLAADALCNAVGGAFTGSKVCTTDEILNSIKCTANASAPLIAAFGNSGWINGGPPGYSASTNDCVGWTSDSSSATTKGRIWTFAATTGGQGWLSFCDAGSKRQIACCK